jgi:hypothetical protein
VIVAMVLFITGCGGSGASGSQTTAEAAATQGSATVKPTPGYPGSVVILGDSYGTGYDSDPNRPNTDVPSNDWATGPNPAVDSVYLRLLARDPAIKGHNYNLAQDGAKVDVLAHDQAPRAVKLTPAPQLFLISTGAADAIAACPADAADVKACGAALAKALSVLASGAPQSHTFIVSQWGNQAAAANALPTPDRQQLGAQPSSCGFFDSNGQVIPDKLARAEATIHSYDAEAQAVCARFSHCRSDGGAFGHIVVRLSYLSENRFEPSVAGLANAAAVAWAAIQRAGVIPH